MMTEIQDKFKGAPVEGGGVATDEELVAEMDAMQGKIEVLEAENAALKRQLGAYKGVATKAKAALAQAEEIAAGLAPRSFAIADDFTPLEAKELLELAEDAEHIELAFYGPDGDELPDVASRHLLPEMLKRGRYDRVGLNLASLLVRGPTGAGERNLAGYALLIDGAVVAKAPRAAGALLLGAGGQYELVSDVLF